MRLRTFVNNDELTGDRAIRLAQRLSSRPLGELQGIVLSLKHAGSVDASGIAVMVRMYSQLARVGKSFALVDGPKDVEKLLRQAGLAFLIDRRDVARRPLTLRRRALA